MVASARLCLISSPHLHARRRYIIGLGSVLLDAYLHCLSLSWVENRYGGHLPRVLSVQATVHGLTSSGFSHRLNNNTQLTDTLLASERQVHTAKSAYAMLHQGRSTNLHVVLILVLSPRNERERITHHQPFFQKNK
jgi:hypothetical protein